MEDQTNTKESWTISEKEMPKEKSLTMLTMMGKVVIIRLKIPEQISFREESAASDCTLCLHHLPRIYLAIGASFYFE